MFEELDTMGAPVLKREFMGNGKVNKMSMMSKIVLNERHYPPHLELDESQVPSVKKP